MPLTQERAERLALALELQRELVRVTVERWDIERRIEVELGNNAELEFMPGSPIYDLHISDNAVACYSPEYASQIVTEDDAVGFLETIAEEAEAYHKRTSEGVPESEEDCTCAERSWYGPEHDSACAFAGQPREEAK
jgi:hypothetical protein